MKREFALPGARARYIPDRVCRIRHIRLDLDIDIDAARISGTCTLSLSPVISGMHHLRLDAVELDIAAVRRSGKALPFSHDGKILSVDLGMVTEGDSFDLEIDYSGHPRRGIYFVGPDESYPDKPRQVWTQGQDEDSRFWFPCFDSPSEKSTSEVIATVPEPFFAVSNGTLLDNRVEGDRRTLHWRFDTPHSCYLITLAAGELTCIADRWRDIDVTYYVAPGREDDARRTLGRTPGMLELFSRLFEMPYPYEKYAQVCVADFIFGGMENTTATTLTDIVLYDERAALDFDADALVAHELAHQWFGDLLTCRSWAEGWLNEGFATYAEYLWREEYEGRDAADHELDEWGEQYFAEDSSRYRRIVATNVYEEPIEIFDAHLYEKGGRILHMLRGILGDEAFFRAIRHYLVKHQHGSVETRDLARAVEDATGRGLEWFFDQWVSKGAGHPELEVSYSWDSARKLTCLSVKQTHEVDSHTPLFRLPLILHLEGKDGTREVALDVTEAQHTFCIPADEQPRMVVLDPGKALLAKIKFEKPVPLWIAELESAELAIDRVHAARALGQKGGAAATDALCMALAADPAWMVQAAAAAALGQIRTGAARDALIMALEQAGHPKARRAIARALGSFRGDEAAGRALADRVRNGDASYFVEAEACLALGNTRTAGAGEVLRQACQRESFLDVIRQHAYRGLAALRDESAIELLVDGAQYGKISHGRRAAITALAELCRGRRDRAERDARELIEELLRDPDFRVQASALEALSTLADPASIGALQSMIDRELDGRLRRRAREIIRDIRESRAASGDLSELRDEIDRLRRHTIELGERMARLEGAQTGPSGATRQSLSKARSKKAGSRTASTGTAAKPATRRKKPAARSAKASGKTAARGKTAGKAATRGKTAARGKTAGKAAARGKAARSKPPGKVRSRTRPGKR